MHLFRFLLRRHVRGGHLDAEVAPPSVEGIDDDGERRVRSGDVLREQRLPPGQAKAKKWPVLHYGDVPEVEAASWRLRVFGVVARELLLSWDDLLALPRVRVHADMHCVTTWSVLDQQWEGVALADVLALADVSSEARFLVAWGADRVGASERYSTNMPLEPALALDALIATHCNGAPLTPEHGGPARLVVPRLYAWKSAKWVDALELLTIDRPGFWERNGYHDRGDPWAEERHR